MTVQLVAYTVAVLVVFVALASWVYSVLDERGDWNNGRCYTCGTPWELSIIFRDRRMYRCPHGDGMAVISNTFVDGFEYEPYDGLMKAGSVIEVGVPRRERKVG